MPHRDEGGRHAGVSHEGIDDPADGRAIVEQFHGPDAARKPAFEHALGGARGGQQLPG